MSTTILNTTSTPKSETGELVRPAARAAIAAILAYWALSIAVVAAKPQWNPLTRQLSEYALGEHGWLQVAAFLAQAVAYASLAVALRGLAGRIGLGILAYCALGSIGVGVFTTDPINTRPDAVTAHGVLHTAFGGSALILLPVAALLITRSIARRRPDAGADPQFPRRVGYLPFAGLALIWIPESAGLIPVGGWPDRTLFLTYTIWLLAVATHTTRAESASRDR